MSDSIKAWHEMEDSEKAGRNHANKICKRHFIWVLDHEYGTVHLYNIKRTDLDMEDYEKLIELHGHKVNKCQWMITERDQIYK
tara:strand:- start:61 stop:309 length:249 start_codon:yes stop_codon:yes gene_type:complete